MCVTPTNYYYCCCCLIFTSPKILLNIADYCLLWNSQRIVAWWKLCKTQTICTWGFAFPLVFAYHNFQMVFDKFSIKIVNMLYRSEGIWMLFVDVISICVFYSLSLSLSHSFISFSHLDIETCDFMLVGRFGKWIQIYIYL